MFACDNIDCNVGVPVHEEAFHIGYLLLCAVSPSHRNASQPSAPALLQGLRWSHATPTTLAGHDLLQPSTALFAICFAVLLRNVVRAAVAKYTRSQQQKQQQALGILEADYTNERFSPRQEVPDEQVERRKVRSGWVTPSQTRRAGRRPYRVVLMRLPSV